MSYSSVKAREFAATRSPLYDSAKVKELLEPSSFAPSRDISPPLDFSIAESTPQILPERAFTSADVLKKVFVEKKTVRPPFGKEAETQEVAGGLFTQVPLEIGSRLLELPAQIGKDITEIASTLFPNILQRTPIPREKERVPSRLRETIDIYEAAIRNKWSDSQAAGIATVYGVSSFVADIAIGTDILARTTLRALGLTPQLRSAMRNLGVGADETIQGYHRNASRLFGEAVRANNKEQAIQTLRDVSTINGALETTGISQLNTLGRSLVSLSEKALEPLLGREAVRIPRLAREQLPGFRARPGQAPPLGLSLEELEPVGLGSLIKGDKVVARPKAVGGVERTLTVIKASAEGITAETAGDFRLPTLFKASDFKFFREAADLIPATPKEISPDLAQEARKYKSAEEFVGVQGEPLFHGTSQKFEGAFIQPEKGVYGSEAIFLATSRKGAEYYVRDFAKGEVKEVFVKKGTKIWDFQNPSDIKIVEDFVNKVGVKKVDPRWIAGKDKWIKRLREGDYSIVQRPEVMELLRAKGYGGFKQFDWYDYGREISIGIFDAKNVQTKSQLTDFYNQAIKEIAPEPIGAVRLEISETSEIPATLQEFERLPFEQQELIFEQIPREMQMRFLGYDEAYGQSPVKQLASDIARGKIKVRTGKSLGKDALEGLGRGNYARIFRTDKNLEALDGLASTVGIGDDELLQEIIKEVERIKEDIQSGAKRARQLFARQTLKEQKTSQRAAEKAAKLERKQQEVRERTLHNIENITRGNTENSIASLESRFLSAEDIENIVLEDGTKLIDTLKVKRNNDGSLAAVITKREMDEIKKNYTEELPKEKWTERSMLVEGKEMLFNVAISFETPALWFERKGLSTIYDSIIKAGRDSETLLQMFVSRFEEAGLFAKEGLFTANKFLLSSLEAKHIGQYFLARQGKGYTTTFEQLSERGKKFVRIFDGITHETEQPFFEVAKKNGKTPNKVIDYAPLMVSDDKKLADELGAQEWLFRKHPAFFSTKERVEEVPISLYETDYREIATRWLKGISEFLNYGETTQKLKYLIESAEFKSIVTAKDWQFIHNWLQDITTPSQPKTFIGKALTIPSLYARRVTAISALGLNYATVLKQTLSFIPLTIIERAPPKLHSEFAKAFGISVADLPSITKRRGDIAISDLQGKYGRIFTGGITELDRKVAQLGLNGLLDKDYVRFLKEGVEVTPEIKAYILKRGQDRIDMWMGNFFKGGRPEVFRQQLGNFIFMFLFPLNAQLNGFIRHILQARESQKPFAIAEVLAAMITIGYLEQVIENLSPQWSDEVEMTKDVGQSVMGNIPVVSDLFYAFLNEKEVQVSPVIGNLNSLLRSLEKKNERTVWAFAETLGTPKQFRKIREGMKILEDGGITDNDGKMLVQVSNTIELMRSFLRGKYGSLAAKDWIRNIGEKKEDHRWFVPEVEFLQSGDYTRKAELYRSFDHSTRKELYDFLSEAQQKRLDNALNEITLPFSSTRTLPVSLSREEILEKYRK